MTRGDGEIEWKVLSQRQAKALAAFVESGALNVVLSEMEQYEAEAMVQAARVGEFKALRRAGEQVVAIRDLRQVIELRVKQPELVAVQGGSDGEAA